DMSVHNMFRQVRFIIRAEMLAVQAKLAFAARRTVLAALALLFAGLGLVFSNVALFAFLSPLWGPVGTPVSLGLLNVALAGVALLAAALMKPGPELALAEEMRNIAGQSLEEEIRSQPLVGAALGGPDRTALAGLLLPALTMIVGALRQRRKEKG
ncbi:hypothetical protein, partial [Aestuariivirga sp.]|uniref:hypothetical protein n=1 Tax=Aestuariivirga sp. TaxID=2650926 RepID=UPI00391DB3D9